MSRRRTRLQKTRLRILRNAERMERDIRSEAPRRRSRRHGVFGF